jgi:hypothetical protein
MAVTRGLFILPPHLEWLEPVFLSFLAALFLAAFLRIVFKEILGNRFMVETMIMMSRARQRKDIKEEANRIVTQARQAAGL